MLEKRNFRQVVSQVMVLACVFVSLIVGAAPAAASPAVAISPQFAQALGVAVPGPYAPPPPLKDENGDVVAGSWWGPRQLQAMHSHKCLDMYNSTAHGAPAYQNSCQTGRRTQLWWFWVVEPDCCVGVHYIKNDLSDKCLDVPGAVSGQQLKQHNCVWDSSQVWLNTGGVMSGWWSFTNDYSHFCMDVRNGSMVNGAVVQQYTCNGTEAQKWSFD